jgi:negative regulator of sigma E activity
MSDERDPKLSRRYRELASEEPSRELDQSILAAAHRAAERAHAPLVTPAGRHRWYFGLGAAAVLVLAVAVTVHVERDRPDPEAMTTASPAPEAASVPPPQVRAERQAARPSSGVASTQDYADRTQSEAPERWIERILELRKAGKHEAADKELAEFRKRYPDWKLPENVVRP